MDEIDYMSIAKEILESGEEYYDSIDEKKKKQLIIALCLKFGFKYKFINDFVFINSIIDEWYFPYMRNIIPLLHRNKFHTINQFHFQKKFKNVVYVLKYIKKHDNYCYKPRKFKFERDYDTIDNKQEINFSKKKI